MGIRERLDRHWFHPIPARDLAIVRMVVVGTLLVQLVFPGIAHKLGIAGSYGLASQAWLLGLSSDQFIPIPTFKLLLLPFADWGQRPEFMFLQAIWVVAVASGMGAFVGLFTRLSMFVFAATTTLLAAHSYSYGEFHHPETIPTIASWILAFGPIGSALSIDALRERVRLSVHAMRFEPHRTQNRLDPFALWPLRTVQWIFALAYLSAGFSKIYYGGASWFTGLAIASPLARDWLWYDRALPAMVLEIPYVLSVFAIGTVVIELGFVLAILVPRLVWYFVVGAAGFHISIFILQGADFLQWVLLYVIFLPSLRENWPLPRLRKPAPRTPPAWTVVYDGKCPLCVRSMTTLDAFDLRQRIAYVDLEDRADFEALAANISAAEARHAMHVLGPDGTLDRGYDAWVALAGPIPLLWPLRPLLAIPGVGKLGAVIYDAVARRRERQLCRADSCPL